MPTNDRARAQLQIHFCVLLWGFTAILGKLITLPALPLVWWRMLLVVAALALIPRVWRGLRALSRRLLLAYAGIGVLERVDAVLVDLRRVETALHGVGQHDQRHGGDDDHHDGHEDAAALVGRPGPTAGEGDAAAV